METLIDYKTLPKIKKLLNVVGGRILLEETHYNFVRLIIEKVLRSQD
ncbi:MAG: hypothetical protein U9N19_08440 [Thermodesulfobacteriota bacterium]|nr:hypothetical protein [Thermodesulfobacteriota bacterium]